MNDTNAYQYHYLNTTSITERTPPMPHKTQNTQNIRVFCYNVRYHHTHKRNHCLTRTTPAP